MKNKLLLNGLAFVMLGLMLIMPELAMAAGKINSAIGSAISMLCTEVVRGVAMIAFIAVALAALTGRLNWGVVVIVIVVIGVVFMAPYIVSVMYGGSAIGTGVCA